MEFIAIAALAFVAAFRGWGFWPFPLAALPFASGFTGGSVEIGTAFAVSSFGSVLWLTAVSGLGLMILMGRET
jgi:hypothetical protein